jgi:hypothetical protein
VRGFLSSLNALILNAKLVQAKAYPSSYAFGKAVPARQFGTNGVAKTPALPQKPRHARCLTVAAIPFLFFSRPWRLLWLIST